MTELTRRDIQWIRRINKSDRIPDSANNMLKLCDLALEALNQREQGGCFTKAASDVLAERHRQVSKEGWTPAHDDEHGSGDLANAAAAYAHISTLSPALYDSVERDPVDVGLKDIVCARRLWPWHYRWFKPKGPRRDLVRAGALILAEIERLDRLPTPPAKETE